MATAIPVRFILVLAAGLLSAPAAAAPPAWTPVTTPVQMVISGEVLLLGTPAPSDNESLLAVFTDNLATPIGLFRMGSDPGAGPGAFGPMKVFGNDQQQPTAPKTGANPGDNLTFLFYYAVHDELAGPGTVVSWSRGKPPVTFAPQASDNVTLDFTVDRPPTWRAVGSPLTIITDEFVRIQLAEDPDLADQGSEVLEALDPLPSFCSLERGAYLVCIPAGRAGEVGSRITVRFRASSNGLYAEPDPTPVEIMVVESPGPVASGRIAFCGLAPGASTDRGSAAGQVTILLAPALLLAARRAFR